VIKMSLKVLGTRGEIEETSKKHKKHSGILIDDVLFDLGEPIYLDLHPKAIFLSHLHPDHYFPEKYKKEKNPLREHSKIPIYSIEKPRGAENWIKLEKGKEYKVNDLIVIPIPTVHSKKVKTTGFLIKTKGKRILYTSDLLWIKKKWHDKIKDLDVVITDGSSFDRDLIRRDKETGQPYGHASVKKLVKFFKDKGAKNIIITHYGKWLVEEPKKGYIKIKELTDEKTKVIPAKDGDEFSLEELITTEEIKPMIPKVIAKIKPKWGLYLVKPHGELIASGKKKLIVKSKRFESHINEPLYLLEDNLCWGIISLQAPEKISWEKFLELQEKHLISEEEVEDWNWNRNNLYAYEFQVLKVFDPPLPVKVPKGVQVFVSSKKLKWKKEFSLLDLLSYETEIPEVFLEIREELSSRGVSYHLEGLIKESTKDWVKSYIKNLEKYTRAQVGDDWRIVLGWYSSLKRGKKLYKGKEKIPITIKDCQEIGLAIVKELIKRGCTFNAPSTYKKYARELFEWIIKKIGGIEKIPWKKGQKPEKLENKKIDPSKVTREQLEFIDAPYCKSLSDKELKALNKRLHELYRKIGKVIEPLENAHIFTWNEMRRRGIPQEIWDGLTEATALEVIEYPEPEFGKPQKVLSADEERTLEEIINSFPDKIEINFPYHIYLVGGVVNREKDLKDHDIDLLFKQPYPFINPTIKSFLYQIAQKDPKLAEKLHLVWDPHGPQIGYCVPLYKMTFEKVPAKYRKRSSPYEWLSEVPKLFKPSIGMKPRSGLHKNEFFDVKEMWEKWGKKFIDRGIVVQKKYDGMRFQIHVKGNKVACFTEDRKRDRASVFKKSIKELLQKKTADNFILDAEMVEYDCHGKEVKNELEKICTPLKREDMIKWIGATKKGLDDENVVFHVHDCLMINGEPIHNKGCIERWKAIRKCFPDKLKHWSRVPSELATNAKEFFRAVDKMRSIPGSEGVVCKAADSPYRIKFKGENRPDYWCKLKNLKEIDVMVYKVIQKKTKEGKPLDQYLYVSAFRIPCTMYEKFKPDKVFKKGGKCYSIIGRTYATSEKCKPGDIITVRPIKIDHFEDKKTGKIWYVWMFPLYAGKHPAKKEPDSLDVVKKIEAVGTGPTKEQRVTLSKLVFKLEPCPFWNDERICPFKTRFFIPRDKEKKELSEKIDKIEIEYLKFPIVCRFANVYRCRFVKPYYYDIKEFKVKEIDEDTGEEIEDNS